LTTALSAAAVLVVTALAGMPLQSRWYGAWLDALAPGGPQAVPQAGPTAVPQGGAVAHQPGESTSVVPPRPAVSGAPDGQRRPAANVEKKPAVSHRPAKATQATVARGVRKPTRVPTRPAALAATPTVAPAAPVQSPEPLPARALSVPPAPGAVPATPVPEGPSVAPGARAVAFEPTSVDVRPQVASRVEARIAGAARQAPEVLVLRVLVTSAGRPGDVRLLRGSRTDPAADRAAMAAVRQWRFTPAQKRGQSVDCWLNVGVPVTSSGT
jgi:protein TonB